MTVLWKINNLYYYLSKSNKDKVVYKVRYNVSDSKVVDDKTYSASLGGFINLETDVVEAVEAKDAVLYTDKDTLLVDKAVKVGDIKTPAVEAVEAKNPWASVDFVEYDKLTEDVVIGWVKAGLSEEGVKAREDNIAAQIYVQENPPAATEGSGVPW
tara:strand:+ start:4222 stop:4689 length:468 start_codon:yes stop_codon:yes gene_type:complete